MTLPGQLGLIKWSEMSNQTRKRLTSVPEFQVINFSRDFLWIRVEPVFVPCGLFLVNGVRRLLGEHGTEVGPYYVLFLSGSDGPVIWPPFL